MAIYFGNLDRELADRQNVLKEDAARQYRGYRDVQQNFGSLGDAVSTGIKDVAQAKLDQAKLQYNIRRNEEADEIRAEQHTQATQRNRELSLDSTLKNIGRFRKSSIEDYIGRLWFWRDPKTVRASYAERMKIFTADKDTLTAEERIRLYPNLFGTKALKKLEIYNLLLKQKRDGITTTDADLKGALDKLPLTPMNFMDWAKDTGMYNQKMKGINPTKISNAMQRAALIEAGYNIPDPGKLLELNQDQDQDPSATTVSLEEAAATEAGTAVGLGGINLSSTPDSDAEKEARQKVDELGIDLGVGGVYTDPVTKEKLSLGGGGIISEEQVPDQETIEKLGQGHYKDGVWVSAIGDVLSLTGAGEVDTSVGGVTAAEAAANEAAGGITATEVGSVPTKKDNILTQEKSEAQEIANEFRRNEASIRYRRQAMKSPDYPGRENPFKVAAQIVAPSVDSIILGRDEVKRDPGDKLYTLEGSERDRDPRFFPFMEASRGRKLGAYYGKQPNYSTRIIPSKHIPGTPLATLPQDAPWENVSPEEKAAILRHPAIEFGSSPKSVAGLIKAEAALAQIDEEILFINGQVSKGSKPDVYDPQMKWKQGQEKTTHFEDDFYNYMRPSLSSDMSPEGGALSPAAQGAISNVKDQQAKDISKQLPRLENQRKQLEARVKYAEADVYASQSDKSKSTYRGSLASDFGVSNTSGQIIPSTIRPEPRVDTTSGTALAPGVNEIREYENEMERPRTSSDPGTQAAIDANYAEDTQKEIIGGIIDREGFGPAGEGYSYFDGPNPGLRGYYIKGDAEILTLAGGNNIWGTINGMSPKEKKIAIEEVSYSLFGQGGVRKREFIKFINMPKKDHKKEYDTIVKRGRLRLTEGQRNYLTDYSYKNHLERMVKHHPYLSGIAQYPKVMQVFLMDNAFNMGPRWLKDKFIETEKHLRRWVKTRLPSDLEKMKKEYKNSDHYRETTRAKDLIAMLG